MCEVDDRRVNKLATLLAHQRRTSSSVENVSIAPPLLALGLATRRVVAPYPVVVARLEGLELQGGQSAFAAGAQEVVHVPVGIGCRRGVEVPGALELCCAARAEAVGFGEVAGE